MENSNKQSSNREIFATQKEFVKEVNKLNIVLSSKYYFHSTYTTNNIRLSMYFMERTGKGESWKNDTNLFEMTDCIIPKRTIKYIRVFLKSDYGTFKEPKNYDNK